MCHVSHQNLDIYIYNILYRLIWMYLKIIGDYTQTKILRKKYNNLTCWDSGYGLVNFGFTHCGCSVFVAFL